MAKRPTPPGKVSKFRKKPTEYAIQLREKQKVKRYYGILEKQFKNTFEIANRRKGVTGVILLQILETRLDNLLYRSAFAPSRKAARQIISHGHVSVNGKRVDIPSYIVSVGEVIEIAGNAKNMDLVVRSVENAENRTMPVWLDVDLKNLKATVKSLPSKEEMNLELDVNEQLIVELYSK
jgi:small subunit ribosomal protein S4